MRRNSLPTCKSGALHNEQALQSEVLQHDAMRYHSKEEGPLERNTFNNLIRRVARAGFKQDFVRGALLPDWWNQACEKDSSLLPEVEFRIARFFGVPIEVLREQETPLLVPDYPAAQLRKVANLDRDRLKAAVHVGLKIAAAVVRSLRDPSRLVSMPSDDPSAWFQGVSGQAKRFDLRSIVGDLWKKGIPVVHAETLPAPKFQGLACIVEGRPVIVLGHANDAPPRLAFHLAHEVGHLVHGDCAPDAPVVDENETVQDSSMSEQLADEFAWKALAAGEGLERLGDVPHGGFREWAKAAAKLQKERGIDSGVVVWAWANRVPDFKTGQMALKALYRSQNGKKILRDEFDRNVNLEVANETDRALLKCVFGDPERNAAAD